MSICPSYINFLKAIKTFYLHYYSVDTCGHCRWSINADELLLFVKIQSESTQYLG